MRNINTSYFIKISLLSLCFIFFSTSTITAQESPKALFKQAIKTYEKAVELKKQDENNERSTQLFEETKAIYEKLIGDYGCHNAYMYYNLGNSLYQLGLIGEAIYNYRMAQKLDPAFDDARINLNQARRLIDGYIEDESESNISKALFFWHYSTSVQFRLIVGIILFVLVWVSAFLFLFMKKRFIITITIILSIILIIFFSSVIIQYIGESNSGWGVITDHEGVIARKGPGNSYEARFVQSLNEGIEFNIIEKDGEWLKIRLRNNEIAWIPSISCITHQEKLSFK